MLARLRASLATDDRDQTADLLKGLAVLFMILVHLVELFATPQIYQSLAGRVALFLGGPPAAPVFLAVMGCFLASTRKSPVQLIRRGLLLILGGLALNIGLNFNLLLAIQSGRVDLDPLAYIFGADILPLAGLSMIVIALLRPAFKNSWIAYLLLAFAVSALGGVLRQLEFSELSFLKYAVPFFWGESSWSYFPLFPWFAYPLLGYAYAAANAKLHLASRLTQRVRLILVAIFVFGLSLFSQHAIAVSTDLPRYYHHTLPFTLWVAAFLCGWSLIVSFIEARFGTTLIMMYFKWIGRNVTAAYVFQWLLIGNVATELYRTQNEIQAALWFFVVVAVTTLCVVIWRKLKPKVSTLLTSSVAFP